MAVLEQYRVYSTRALHVRKALPMFAAALFAIVIFAVADVFLKRVTEARRASSAQWSYSEGERLSKSGRFSDAVERFRSAYNLGPTNSGYQLALVGALRSAGETDQAKLLVGRMLEKSPADGAANIEMARILAKSGDWHNAAWYYHRGLYGQWRGPAAPISVRFELADLLAVNQAKEDLAAELPLLDREIKDPLDLRHLGKLLLSAQLWKRAGEVYSSLLKAESANGELWAGLGRAQLGAGEYMAAEQSLRKADTYSPDSGIKRDLELSTEINQLDPRRRNLDPSERHRRAHKLASAVAAALESCAPGNPDAASARAQLDHEPRMKAAELTEADLDFTDRLWGIGESDCRGHLPVSEPVRRVVTLMLK